MTPKIMQTPVYIYALDGQETTGLYHYIGSGLDNYWLAPNLYELGEHKGIKTISFPRLYDVQSAIGMHICAVPRPLAPREVRFLRSEIGLSQTDMGHALGYSDKTQIEAAEKKEATAPLSGSADLLLRNIYLTWLGKQRLTGEAFREWTLGQGQNLQKPKATKSQIWQVAA